MIKAIRGSTIW